MPRPHSFTAWLDANFLRMVFEASKGRTELMDSVTDYMTYVNDALDNEITRLSTAVIASGGQANASPDVRNLNNAEAAMAKAASEVDFKLKSGLGAGSVEQILTERGGVLTRFRWIEDTPINHTLYFNTSSWDYAFINSSVGLDQTDMRQLIASLTDSSKRHNSSRVRGAPDGMAYYTHNYGDNRLLAVTAWSPGNKTVTVAAEGDVSDGLHRF